MVAITIRPATADDAAALASVEVATWRVAYRTLMPAAFLDGLSVAEKTADWHHNLLKHGTVGRKRVRLATADDDVIGFVRVGEHTAHDATGMVYIFYVLPAYWRCGVGTRLLHAAHHELRELGMRQAVLWVLRDNQRARSFYERLGWSDTGHVSSTNYGGVILEACCYQRSLDELEALQSPNG